LRIYKGENIKNRILNNYLSFDGKEKKDLINIKVMKGVCYGTLFYK